MLKTLSRFRAAIIAGCAGLVLVQSAEAWHEAWQRRLENANFYIHDTSADGLGNIYIAGELSNFHYASPDPYDTQAFLRKYDLHGNVQWTQYLQTGNLDRVDSLQVDAIGNAYVLGVLNENLSEGIRRPFLAKYDRDGNQQWLSDVPVDLVGRLSIDNAGNSYAISAIYSTWSMCSYDAAGEFRWEKDLGSQDSFLEMTSDGFGNVYTIQRQGDYSYERELIVRKYDTSGTLSWTKNVEIEGYFVNQYGPHFGMAVDHRGYANVFYADSTPYGGASSVITVLNSAGDVIAADDQQLVGAYISKLFADHSGRIHVYGTETVYDYENPGNPPIYYRFITPGGYLPDEIYGGFLAIGGGYSYLTDGSLITQFANSPQGDFNRNGVVDAADYVIWRKELGRDDLAGCSGPDDNCNGFVDNDDYRSWARRFGNTSINGAAAVISEPSSVPELNSFVSLFLGATTLFAQRRFNGHRSAKCVAR
jgi:hypothetical protein